MVNNRSIVFTKKRKIPVWKDQITTHKQPENECNRLGVNPQLSSQSLKCLLRFLQESMWIFQTHQHADTALLKLRLCPTSLQGFRTSSCTLTLLWRQELSIYQVPLRSLWYQLIQTASFRKWASTSFSYCSCSTSKGNPVQFKIHKDDIIYGINRL